MSTPKASAAPAQRAIAKPKGMSSKLLTMKFMQRTAAPTAVRAALAQEESKRDAAREKMIAATTPVGDVETRWELSYVHRAGGGGGAAKVVDWGYSEILADDRRGGQQEDSENSDGEGEEEEEEKEEKGGSGRMVFGAYKSKGEAVKAADENDSGDESDASDKPKRDVSLRGLTSISNSGPPPSSMAMKCRGCGGEGHTQAMCPKAKCYACDGEGHMAKDCPRPRKGRKRETMAFGSDSKRRRPGN
ncbi:hypothetical protein DFP73DRAFT_566047 [Morchella snyderi]|nr:hypothetical protein DFP73DRAFT_566047 [Morchella snyderi]